VARVGLARFLVDTSAIARARHEPVAERLEQLREGNDLATCSVVDLEVLFTARSPEDYADIRTEHRILFARAPIDQAVLDRAEEVQAELARSSRHRGVGGADLVIAATAERAGLSVLHYDAHYDLIAEVTGQPAEWVVPRGSVR
jgi:predicted nucleic acid-binding protein